MHTVFGCCFSVHKLFWVRQRHLRRDGIGSSRKRCLHQRRHCGRKLHWQSVHACKSQCHNFQLHCHLLTHRRGHGNCECHLHCVRYFPPGQWSKHKQYG